MSWTKTTTKHCKLYTDYKHRLSKKGTYIIFALKRSQSSVSACITLSTNITIIIITIIIIIIIIIIIVIII